jgi:hypothetical protein
MFPRPHFINREPSYTWDGRQVVRELSDRPHLLTRIEVRGTFFPHMGREPFMRIVLDNEDTVRAWLVDVCDDHSCLRGYFPNDLPDHGIIEFGYGADLMGRVDFEARRAIIQSLDRERLPKETVMVTREFVERQLNQ